MRKSTNIPCVVRFEDYHEIEDFKDSLRNIIPGIKAKEVAFDYYYYGLFYKDKLPSKESLLELLKKAGFDTDHAVKTGSNYFDASE
jgi:hypothetical protein